MPVRIYDIAKKLGMESKDVLAKAKALGITGAKVPSSSLDKITAEYLLTELGGLRPSQPEVIAPPPPEMVVIRHAVEPETTATVSPSSPEPEPTPDQPTALHSESPAPPTEFCAELPAAHALATTGQATELAPLDAAAPSTPAPPSPAPIQSEVPSPIVIPPPSLPPATPAPPAPPPKVALGAKVGFIQLPQRPTGRAGDRTPATRSPVRSAVPGARPPSDARPPQRFGRTPPPSAAPPRQQAAPTGGRQLAGSGSRSEFQQATIPSEPKFSPPATGELISLKPPIIVRDLAEKLGKKPFLLIAELMKLNVFANVNQAIDELVAQKLCARFGFRFEVEKRERGMGMVHAPVRKVEIDIEDRPDQLKTRAPVVTIMGHVDHGKTTLLDVIRKSDVAAEEAGGITQHIGAYTISVPHPERKGELTQITFLDTPGHAAFSSMRARGANVTDLVVLVVAANDGVMPQTLEALSHAKAAKVPILVAVNKVDHPSANPTKVRQQLAEHGLTPDEWGGDTIYVDVSAVKKTGIDKLLEMIVFQADLLELKANPERQAKGNVIESALESGGPTATVLVRKGTLRVGDIVIAGPFHGRVRALINEEGKRLKEAGPSVAVKVLGLNGVPEAGLEFGVMESEKDARLLAEERKQAARSQEKERRPPKVGIEFLFDALASEASKVLRVVVKGDTQGSVEAIVEALRNIASEKIKLEIIHSAVGTITKEDVMLASASQAVVLGFHTRIDAGVSDLAKREGVQIKLYAIIYELVDQVKDAMAGLLDPLVKEVVIGQAEVRKVFGLSKGGNVAGCYVLSGRLVKGKMRVQRRRGLIYEGVSLSLRRFQDEVNEVRSGTECGIRLDGFDDFQVGDIIECYTLEKIPQKL